MSELPRVTVVFGTRPEAIKMAPVVRALKATPSLRTRVCVTGQHREMLDQILAGFAIVPDADLNVMQPGQTLAGLTSRAMTALDAELAANPADLLLVQGDTTTAFASALTAFYRRIPVGHVEAGLRTGNLQSPWPEEANRVLISRLASLNFPPTPAAAKNLLNEGVSAEAVLVTGNTVVDALLQACAALDRKPVAVPGLPPDLLAGSAPIVLITGHRRENFGQSFDAICHAIADLAQRFPATHFIYPVHLNPNVQEPVRRILGVGRQANVHLLEPLPYFEFLTLFRRCRLVLSDSGGVQEEAPSLNKPVLLMRDTTERPEAVAVGAVKLVGTDRAAIVAETARLLTDAAAHASMTGKANPFGDGRAAERIAERCATFLARR